MSLAHLLAYYTILLACGAVCAAKGKYRFFAVGIVLPFFWIVGAVGPAKHESIWARVHYTYFARDVEKTTNTWH